MCKLDPTLACDICQERFPSSAAVKTHRKECKERQELKDKITELEQHIKAQPPTQPQQLSLALPDMETLVQLITKAARELAPQTQIHTNSHNNTTFNVQVFLNEHCKDAMNIMDFAKSLEIQLSDVEHLGKVGYVRGITDVVTKGLSSLALCERPIHCTDVKRETVHVKHENKWQKEEPGLPILLAAVKHVAFRNMRQVSDQWLAEHRDKRENDNVLAILYESVLKERIGGISKDSVYQRKNCQILKNVCRASKLDRTIALQTNKQ